MSADFPALRKGEVVFLGDSARVVTSCRADITLAGLTVGLSDSFRRFLAAYEGTRRENGRARPLSFPLDALMLETGADAVFDEGSTSTTRRAYLVYVPSASWPEVKPPQTGDKLTLKDGQRLSVKDAPSHKGYWLLEARTC